MLLCESNNNQLTRARNELSQVILNSFSTARKTEAISKYLTGNKDQSAVDVLE